MKNFILILIATVFNSSFLFSQSVNVTLMVDMQNQTVSSSGVYVAGTFNGWSMSANSMSDADGDQVYEVTLSLSSNSGHEFKFINGNSWEGYISGSCANNFGNGPNRWLSVGSNDQVEPAYQFGSCNVIVFYGCTDIAACNYDASANTDDGSCEYSNTGASIFTACSDYNWDGIVYTVSGTYTQVFTNTAGCDSVHTLDLTIENAGCLDSLANNYDATACSDDGSCTYTVTVEFNVDMNNEVVSPSGVHIAGTFTSWTTDSIEMLDLDGDGIYTVSIDLNQGWYYEYKYLNGDNSSAYETLASWESCSNGGGNRVLNTDTTSTQVLSAVCFSSCATCPVYGCTDPIATNYDSTATVDDGSCIYFVYGCMDITSCNYNPLATIDDGSCYNLTVDLGNDTSVCSSADFILTIYGNYSSYEWNTSETSSQIIISSSGNYSVLVSDSLGCEASDTILISLSNPPLVDIGNDQKLCLGDSLILDAGSDWTNYLWSDSTTLQTLVVNTFGLYYVTVTDSLGCQGSDYVNITMDTFPVAGFTYTINGLTVDFIDTSSNATLYLWDFMSDGTFIDTIMGDVSFTYQNPGFFDVNLLVSNSCGTDTFTSTIDLISNDIKSINSNFQIYPNPSKNQIYIELDKLSTFSQLTITDFNGKTIFSEKILKLKSILDISFFPKGVYLITLDNKERITHQKLVIH